MAREEIILTPHTMEPIITETKTVIDSGTMYEVELEETSRTEITCVSQACAVLAEHLDGLVDDDSVDTVALNLATALHTQKLLVE